MRGVIFSAVNCAATSKINVSAKIANEIVVNFNENNNHAELIDEATGEERVVFVSCDAHDSLKQAINVRITGKQDYKAAHVLKSDTNDGACYYHTSVARNISRASSTLWANETRRLERVDGDAKIVVGLALGGGGDDPEPGVTYEDTLTVDVEPAE